MLFSGGRHRLSISKPVSGTRRAIDILAAAVVVVGAFGLSSPAVAADCGSSPVSGIDWSECNKKNLILKGSSFDQANLAGIDFTMTDLSDTDLSSANLEKATLVRAWMTNAAAKKANFAKIEAYRSGFSGIVADGATFSNAELQRANFTGAKLTGVNFEKAELGRANFDKAVLTGTRFSFANLSRARLSGATFEGPIAFDSAFMYRTHIEGVDLSAATGLLQAQVDLACGDPSTKLPADLTVPAGWPCGTD